MDIVGTVKATALVVARADSRRRIMVKNILFMPTKDCYDVVILCVW